MSPRELFTLNHPVHAWVYMTGFMAWIIVLGIAVYYALVGAVFTLRTLIREWLNDDPEQLRLPWRA